MKHVTLFSRTIHYVLNMSPNETNRHLMEAIPFPQEQTQLTKIKGGPLLTGPQWRHSGKGVCFGLATTPL